MHLQAVELTDDHRVIVKYPPNLTMRALAQLQHKVEECLAISSEHILYIPSDVEIELVKPGGEDDDGPGPT